MDKRYPSKKAAWIQIIISGLIGTIIYVTLNVYLSEDVSWTQHLLQGAFFFVVWLLIQALLNRRRFKQTKS